MTKKKAVQKFSRKAIVIGNDCYNTLGVIRSLGEEGVPVYLILITGGKGYVNKSKYIVQSWLIDEPNTHLLPILEKISNGKTEKPVIFPVTDEVVRIIDNNLAHLTKKYVVPNINNTQGRVATLMIKRVMNETAGEFGFAVPKTWGEKRRKERKDTRFLRC